MFLMDHFFTFFLKKKLKSNEKTVISFQSGPNLMSFTFKKGGRGKKPLGKFGEENVPVREKNVPI